MLAAPRIMRGEIVDRPVVEGAGRHDLLGHDIKRVAGIGGLLDQAPLHAVDHHRGFEQVGPVLREELAPARRADLVAGPSDPLHAPADGTRRLDLHHEINGTHVDAELEGRGGNQPFSVPCLS